jgi:hypothetical protein
MSNTFEVISAFIDDEPFDSGELANALADPSGRALLIELLALRHLVQPADVAAVMPRRGERRASIPGLMAAAAVLVALMGGYLAGQSRSAALSAEAPSPTRIVQAPGAWQDVRSVQ